MLCSWVRAFGLGQGFNPRCLITPAPKNLTGKALDRTCFAPKGRHISTRVTRRRAESFGGVPAMFVSNTDPELRSLLAACQAADDPRPPMSALAGWLDDRQDPRAALVRLGTRYWEIGHIDIDSQDEAEFDDLEWRLDA